LLRGDLDLMRLERQTDGTLRNISPRRESELLSFKAFEEKLIKAALVSGPAPRTTP
jgi:hypothetical protein